MTNDEQILNLCHNIYYLRKLHNLSESEMAHILGISPKLLSLIENGILPKKLSTTSLFNLSDYFNIPPHCLFYPLSET